MAASSKALDGIRIVDWTVYLAGPYATALLADLGAEVIHVEELHHGDLQRSNLSLAGQPLAQPGGRQIRFEEHNRNKLSLAVDMTKPEGREVVHRLVAKSDVFVTNFRQKVGKRLGMDYETLRSHNPTLIYALATGYGEKGPEADRRSIDYSAQARSGAMLASGEIGQPPIVLTMGIADRITSMYLLYAVLAAIVHRQRTGVGQQVAVSLFGSMISVQGETLVVSATQATDEQFPRRGRYTNSNPLQTYYRCKDEKWIFLGFAEQNRQLWEEFCQVIGMDSLAEDPRFREPEDRTQHVGELVPILERAFREKTAEQWQAIFERTDMLVSPVKRIRDLIDDPQAWANGYIREWDHPVMGKMNMLGFPASFSETPPQFYRPAPELGEHTEQVLIDVCGYSWDEVSRLRDREVI